MPKHSSQEFKGMVLDFQKHELTAHFVYANLARRAAGKNRSVLKRISKTELEHHNFWKSLSKASVRPDSFAIFRHNLLSRIFGLTFALKLLEKMELAGERKYSKLINSLPKLKKGLELEEAEELKLLRTLSEERLEYVGSIMLGIGDAVVEFTGTLSGLAFALNNTKLIGLAGMIGGIAASLSMASSEYLSKKSEGSLKKNPLKAGIYTGVAYFVVVSLLVLPNFLFENAVIALAGTIINAILVIVVFTYFVSVTREDSFKKRLAETLLVSFGIAVISFLIGIALKAFLNVRV
ncbi:MAG: VIT1/CCC1 transporter family protein [Candidatus Diapherotrites archaeon]|nr:VIT1/CCC1 transporter family protein [Candidatus Diapherotrites archaeon]